MRSSIAQTVRLIRSDFLFRCAYEERPATWRTALRLLLQPGACCVPRYRLHCFFDSNGLAPLGWILKFVNLVFYGVEIDKNARIGGGLYIAHAVTIKISEGVKIGERCALLHQNMIGISPFFEPGREPGPVNIGNDVVFGSGACAYGNIVIGDGCRIGANSTVDRSFSAGSLLVGVPARAVGEPTRAQAVSAGK